MVPSFQIYLNWFHNWFESELLINMIKYHSFPIFFFQFFDILRAFIWLMRRAFGLDIEKLMKIGLIHRWLKGFDSPLMNDDASERIGNSLLRIHVNAWIVRIHGLANNFLSLSLSVKLLSADISSIFSDDEAKKKGRFSLPKTTRRLKRRRNTQKKNRKSCLSIFPLFPSHHHNNHHFHSPPK